MKTIVPLTEFVHGSITAREGRPIEIDDATAAELERAGLVRIRNEPPVNKAAPGKEPDDGAGQPSSVSPPAPVSTPATSPKSKPGEKKGRKAAK